ncbi:HAD-IA family hydrolase [Vibrio penaeicida]|uniref:HAD-IA family hydrolase n=1 Tax=Vibrio penaeicida TaxID=104609 RepID=UPI001CC81F55|nr:HAD-IA family hydrolase [Vibrio penaeicida]
MAKVDAIIFDLDDTLVGTSKVEEFRRTKDVAGLDANLYKTKIYEPVSKMLRDLKEAGIPLGLVTNSPKWYAEKVLAFHDIDLFDALVCYDDVGAGGIKPSPIGIKLAMEKLGVCEDDHVIYVGDAETDFIAAYKAKIMPVAPAWAKRTPIAQIPATITKSQYLVDNIESIEELALIADRTAKERSFDFYKKQLNFIPLNTKCELVPLNREDIKLVAFGRYFSQNSTLTAQLHENHQLSKDIYAKELAESYVIPGYFVDLMSRVVFRLPQYVFEDANAEFDIVTVIPAKKGKNKRLENMLGKVKSSCEGRSEFIPDLFEFSSGAKSLKTLGGVDNRSAELMMNLHIKEKYLDDIKGKTVLVLDDVITTGATFNHAFCLLENAGAAYTFGACLAKTVSVREEAIECPKCARLMQVRTNKKTGIHFYGCTGFFELFDKCTHVESIIIKDCPRCGEGMYTQQRNSDKTNFLGCKGYFKKPQCTHTENLEEV